MTNLLKSNIFKITKFGFFWGCIALCLLDIAVGIITVFAGSTLVTSTGALSLSTTFLKMDTVEIIFMVFAAMLISEDYSTGVIKNVVGRGIKKPKYFMSNVIVTTLLCIVVLVIYTGVMTLVATLKFGFGMQEHAVYYLMATLVKIILLMASFSVVTTTTIITKKVMSGFVIGYGIFYIPTILNLIGSFMKIKFDFSVLSPRYFKPLLASQAGDTKVLLGAATLGLVYLVVSSLIGFWVLKKQDIK